MCSSDCFLAILAVLFPPIAVWVKRGVCSADSIINLALLCLGYLPGLLHAWYIIATYPNEWESAGYYESLEDGRNSRNVYYYSATYPSVAAHSQPPHPPAHNHHHCINTQPPRQDIHPRDYGTTAAGHVNPPTETAAIEQAKPAPQTPTPAPEAHAVVADGMDHGGSSSTAGPSQPPPSYSDVVKGDYKVQTS